MATLDLLWETWKYKRAPFCRMSFVGCYKTRPFGLESVQFISCESFKEYLHKNNVCYIGANISTMNFELFKMSFSLEMM